MNETLLVVVSTLGKIVVILGIVFTIAPVMVWAERRQSAMMQDRIGPVKAGIPLPLFLSDFLRGPAALGARIVGFLLTLLTLAAVLDYFVLPDVAESLGLQEHYLPPWTFWAAAAGAAGHFAAAILLPQAITKDGQATAFGLLHTLVDVIKAIFKEDFIPPHADKLLHSLAPIIALTPALATIAAVPFGDVFYPELWNVRIPSDGGVTLEAPIAIPLQVVNLNVGILYIFAIAGTGIVGAAIAGYASDNKYSLMGGLRAAGQMVSYEVTLGLSLVGAFMVFGTLVPADMVRWQAQNVWGILAQPLGFVLFFAASTAETKRIPFDAPEGESEIVGGYFTEYSGMKFVVFLMGEFIEVITSSAIVITIFLGGYNLPFLDSAGFNLPFIGEIGLQHWAVVGLQLLTFVVKLVLLLWFQLTVRWSLPRFRYDQIMKLCWQVLLPLSLANILVTGILILIAQGN